MPSLVPRRPLTCLSDMGLVTLRPKWDQHCRVQRLLDVDVDARRQVDAHERVHRLRRRVEDVDQTLVRAHLEVLARVLVLVRRRSEEHTSELQSLAYLVCRLLLEKKKNE